MKNLSVDQLVAVVNLRRYPEINSVLVSAHHGDELVSITVSTALDARIELVESRLLAIFPTVVYADKPFVVKDKGNGVSTVLYGLRVGVENVSVTLHVHSTREIEKAPAPTGAPQEISQPNYTSESEVVANA